MSYWRIDNVETPIQPVPAAADQGDRPLPLRQMGIGELIDGAFKLYRRDWLAFMGISALVLIPMTFIQAWFTQNLVAVPAETFEEFDAVQGQIITTTLVFVAIEFLLVQPFLLAAVTRAAADSYLGRRVAIGPTYRFAISRLPAILWVTILTALLVLVGFVLLIIPGIIFALRTTIAAPILVVEDVRGTKAVSRSWNLTRRHTWRIFGTLIVSAIIATIATAVITYPSAFIAIALGPNGWIVSSLGTVLSSVIVTPFSTLIVVLLYFDLRVRKEGYDIAVMAQELAPST